MTMTEAELADQETEFAKRRAEEFDRSAVAADEAGLDWREWADAVHQLAKAMPEQRALSYVDEDGDDACFELGVSHVDPERMLARLNKVCGEADQLAAAYFRARRDLERLRDKEADDADH